ncbi:hypothetical protein AAMO2058_001502600 [Amorphochlora amoebiformis]
MSWLFGDASEPSEGVEEKKRVGPPISILVIDTGKQASDWKSVFKGAEVKGSDRPLRVIQCGWDDIQVMADGPHSRTSCIVNARIKFENGNFQVVTIKPDFVLIRNQVRSLTSDYRSKLYGLMYGNVPSLNSLTSIYMFCERPIVQAELNRLSKEHSEKFRVVPQSYFCSFNSFFYGNKFPAVVKVGDAHAGFGKMKIANHKDMEDFKSGKFDLRIQKIGNHYRAYKRISVSGTWKTNTQTSHCEEIKMTDEYKFWADEASKLFGGLDICTVDAIHNAKDGKEYIMEVNDTASGLLPDRQKHDNAHIRELVLGKLTTTVSSAS